MTHALLSSAARRDLLEAMRWITKDNPSAAGALRHGVSKAAVIVGAHPNVGSLHPELVNALYRCLALTGFPFVIIYHAERRPPLTVGILHGARDLSEVLRDH